MNLMNRFMNWYHGNDENEKEPPRSGMKRIGYVILNYTGKLVLINLIFMICCIPIVTIPAAVSALNCYVGKIFRVGYGMEVSDYWKEFKAGLWKNIPLGILTGVIGFYSYYLLSLANNFPESGQRDAVVGIGIAVAVIAILLNSYLFILTSMVELPNKYILKNAFILMLAEWKRSLIAVVEVTFFGGVVLMTVPYSVLWLLLAGFAIQQLTVCAIIQPAIIRRIVEPYENKKLSAG